ncbi:MAG: hypothetical protein D3916_14470 [Candidatus Electrothrix sp. MAN1_4]|nr:hypothetical protein [Candidatus Electrothrix sp. MAN1_4]
MMTKTIFMMLVGSVVMLGAGLVLAKPMDIRSAEKLSDFRQIAQKVQKGTILSKNDHDFLAVSLSTNDPVLVSLAAWVIGEIGDSETLVTVLKSKNLAKTDDMTKAFISIALDKEKAKSQKEKWIPDEKQVKSTNRYVRIECVREMLLRDKEKGKSVLKCLKKEDDPFVKSAAERILKSTKKEKSQTPLINERYELVLSIIEKD